MQAFAVVSPVVGSCTVFYAEDTSLVYIDLTRILAAYLTIKVTKSMVSGKIDRFVFREFPYCFDTGV